MKCKDCGAARDPSDNYCRNCGRRFEYARPAEAAPAPGEPAAMPARRKGCATALTAASIGIVLFALLVTVLVQTAPDLIKLVGFKPKDLGVKWSAEDYKNIEEKCGVAIDLPPAGTDKRAYRILYSGEQQVDWTLTESEITAWMNTDRAGYWPFSDVQFKIHPDNVMEASFNLDTVKLMTDKDVTRFIPQDMLGYVSGISMKIPAYAKAKVVFTGPKQVEIQAMSFNALGMSLSDIAQGVQVDGILEDVVNAAFIKAGPVEVTNFSTSEGSLRLEGKWYAEMKRVPVK